MEKKCEDCWDEFETDNEKDKYIELVSCFAYNRQKFIEKKIEIGVGLIGRSIQEKETIYITHFDVLLV